MAAFIGTILGIGWAVSGILGWLMMGGGVALGTWRGAIILGPFALLIAIFNDR